MSLIPVSVIGQNTHDHYKNGIPAQLHKPVNLWPPKPTSRLIPGKDACLYHVAGFALQSVIARQCRRSKDP